MVGESWCLFKKKKENKNCDSPFIQTCVNIVGHLSTHNANKYINLMSDKASKMWLVRLSLHMGVALVEKTY